MKNKEGYKNQINKIFIAVIIFLLFIIAILLVLLLTNKNILNNVKTNETVVSSKTVEEESDLKNAISKVYNATVYVEVETTASNGFFETLATASGSGFVYKKEGNYGYIITNYHVINGAKKIKVTYIDGSEADATVVGSDEYSDIAVLRVDAKTVVDVAELGSSSDVELGDTVFTVGAPLGKDYTGTITKGILSGKNRMVPVKLDSGSYLMEALQTDATINSGNSGGPLCNILGQVIGVNSSKLVGDGIEGMGFAIPVDTVNIILKKLEAGKSIDRPYVGVQIADITSAQALSRYYNITVSTKATYGAVLSYVEQGKSAANAGLQVGDVVIEMDGTKIEDTSHFRYYLYKHKVGDKIKVKYYRNNEINETTLNLTDNIE